jgi:hypothetical protein
MAEGWFYSFHMDFQKSNPATEDIGKEDFLLPCDARAGKKNEPWGQESAVGSFEIRALQPGWCEQRRWGGGWSRRRKEARSQRRNTGSNSPVQADRGPRDTPSLAWGHQKVGVEGRARGSTREAEGHARYDDVWYGEPSSAGEGAGKPSILGRGVTSSR